MRRCNVDSEMSIAHAETRNCFGGHSHFTVHARTSVVPILQRHKTEEASLPADVR